MIRILLMDDVAKKRTALRSLLQNECNVAHEQIDEAVSIHDARERLYQESYDLVILDLVMPNYDGEAPNHDDAPNFIDEIYSNPSIKIPNQIIGLTAYAEEFESMKNRFEDKLWYLVHYEEWQNDWKNKIKNKVFHLIKNKKQLYSSIINRNKHDIGIICALEEEYSRLIDAFGDIWQDQEIEEFPLPYKVARITSAYGNHLSVCAVNIGKPGMIATSIIATAMCDVFHVNELFMTGFAAGIRCDNLKLGDIVIANMVQNYSAGKLIDGQEKGDYKLLKEVLSAPAAESLLNKASRCASDASVKSYIYKTLSDKNLIQNDKMIDIHIAPIVCGPFVIATQNIMDEIKASADRKSRALDMEGYGLYLSATYTKCKCLWIKSISDFADSSKGDAYHKQCAMASALFLYKLIKEYL